ncbi:MAG: cysteine desulfurase family protein [Patescibacteria group bacterium]
MKSIYLDHAAGTPLDPRVRRAMALFETTHFANPSAMYQEAVLARTAIEKSRRTVAKFLRTESDTITFTSGGTEANNLAILGVARRQNKQNKQSRQNRHIVTTAIEHQSVLEPIRKLEHEGWEVTYLPVNSEGIVSIEDFKKALRKETALVSIMYANNEVGSIQPIAEIGREILKFRKQLEYGRRNAISPPYRGRRHESERVPRGGLIFHTDACQAAQHLPLHVDTLHADLLTFNGSKIYGPKGIGALYKRRGIMLEPLMYGGGQEFGMRSGTENVPGIVGLGKAVEILQKRNSKEIEEIKKLRNYFWERIQKEIKDVVLNGPSLEVPSPRRGGSGRGLNRGILDRLPNNLNVSFLGCDAEALILYLDASGISVSSGSACSTESDALSHVLLACGYEKKRVQSAIRFTLGRGTTKVQIDRVMKVLPKIVGMVKKIGM